MEGEIGGYYQLGRGLGGNLWGPIAFDDRDDPPQTHPPSKRRFPLILPQGY